VTRLRLCRVIFIFVLFLPGTLFSQEITYRLAFGKNWTEAGRFMQENKTWMRERCRQFKVDYPLAAAVVFPEVIRYSALRDKIEITLLKTLYSYKGAEYADFSVGVFQMKPSCAETVVSMALENGKGTVGQYFRKRYRLPEGRGKRELIVQEMEDPRSQFVYVLSIIRFLEEKYKTVSWESAPAKAGFFAAAYNGGFTGSESRIRALVGERSFYTTVLKPETCYSYAAISEACFRDMMQAEGR